MPVLPSSGPGLGQALLGGVEAFQQGRRDKRAQDLFEEDLARKLAIQNAQLGQQGIHLVGKNEVLPFGVSTGLARQDSETAKRALPQTAAGFGGGFVDPTLAPRAPIPTNGTPPIAAPIPSRAGAGAVNTPGAPQSFLDRITAMVNGPARGPRYERGQGYYIDHKPQWDQQDAALAGKQGAQMFELEMQRMLAERERGRKAGVYAGAGVDPSRAALYAENPALAGNDPLFTKPLPPQAPVMGSPEWLAAQTELAKMHAKYDYHAPSAASADDRTLVPVQQPDGSVTYTPRSQAIGGRVPQPSQNKPATEGERLAAGFASRMAMAAQTLDKLESKPDFDKKLSAGWGAPNGSGNLPIIGNLTLGKDAQVYRQAQANWVRANLRKESGAAIGDDEMAEEIRTYFPQPGDSDDVKKAKRASRALAQQNMVRNAGAGWDAATAALYGGGATFSDVRGGGSSTSGRTGDINLGGDTVPSFDQWKKAKGIP